MTDNELLVAISDMMELHLQPVCQRLDKLDGRLGKLEHRMERLEQRMDHLESRVDGLEKRIDGLEKRIESLEMRMAGLVIRVDSLEERSNNLDNHINGLGETITSLDNYVRIDMDRRVKHVELTVENRMLPVLPDLRSCYEDTYERYRKWADHLEGMNQDVILLKRTVTEHSKKLEQLS